MGVDWQYDGEPIPIFRGRKDRRRRAVLTHDIHDNGDTCITPFNEVELLEEVADAAVAIVKANHTASSKVGVRN